MSLVFSVRHLLQFAMLLGIIAIFGAPNGMAAEDAPAKAAEKKTAEALENPFPNRTPAPDLDGGVEWLNAAGPISIKDLRGKIVLIDFWTFCCINCMHVLPDLAYLEKKYPNELVVVGVHSAKFDNEKETGNIRKAILRYEIEHPVVNDSEMIVWRKFGVKSWPTLVMLDPEGQYCGYVSGEGNREILEKVIDRLIAYHKAKGTLDQTPVSFELERKKSNPTSLKFPGKIIADVPNERLYISDTNHNRIVICTLEGKLVDVIGTGAIGRTDGSYSEAEFDHPQGMTLVGETLYVADTQNHMLRSIDLRNQRVSRFAGTGDQNRARVPGGTLIEAALNSPWDLTVVDGVLYIAMAGPHQIWAHQLGTKSLWQYAGSGREDILNGELDQSALAQPSGIVNDGKNLYVVDSEGSAIRKISTNPQNDLMNPSGTVTTIAGTHDLPRGRSLFEFGDVDETGDRARFQHPLGLAYDNDTLFVADSYNHKIRQVNLKTREVLTWAGTGKPGTDLEVVQFSEPGGVAVADGTMYVADTNNHRIVAIDIKTRKAREFTIAGLKSPNPISTKQVEQTFETTNVIEVDRQELMAGNDIKFRVEFNLPDGFKLNPLLPVSFRLKNDGQPSLFAADELNAKNEASTDGTVSKFSVTTLNKTGDATLFVSLTYGYCRDGKGGVCKVATTHWKIPISLKESAKSTSVNLNVTAK